MHVIQLTESKKLEPMRQETNVQNINQQRIIKLGYIVWESKNEKNS